jgi:hypothetical protein
MLSSTGTTRRHSAFASADSSRGIGGRAIVTNVPLVWRLFRRLA